MKVRDRFDKNRIGDLVCDGAYKYVQNFAVEIDGERVAEYDSLDGVTEEWEDYHEPLIKDPKIRKAIRAWAEANGIGKCICKDETLCITFETERGMFISFEYADPVPPEGNFTIAELCGDEE